MTLKHFLKHQNRSKNKIRKITVKSRNDVKSACFWHVLCHISAIFKDIDLKLCTHIHQPLPSNMLSGFLKILILRGKILKKKKNCRKFWKFWGIFKIFKIRDSSFVAPLILRHFIKTIDCSFKTSPVAAIPVNPYFRSKSAEHDVTLTSFVAELWYPGL